MQGFDSWLWNQASYWDDFCPDSEPKEIKEDLYNCEICENCDCEFWAQYHGCAEEQRVLNPDIAEFVYSLNKGELQK